MNQRRNRTSRGRLFGGSRRRRSSSSNGFMSMLWTIVPLAGFVGTFIWGDNFWDEKFTDLAEWVQKVEPEAVSDMLDHAGLPQVPAMLPGSNSHRDSAAPTRRAEPKVRGFDKERAHFNKCTGRKRVNCIVDGDTLWYKGEKIRIADINAPETSKPDCASERALGDRATNRLLVLMNQGAFSLGANPFGKTTDLYGRRLATITRGGESVGMQLVHEGLAEEWKGRRGTWC